MKKSAQSFFTEKKTFHISHDDLNKLFLEVYNQEILLTEVLNGGDYCISLGEYIVTDKKYIASQVKDILSAGEVEKWGLISLFSDMWQKGFIEKGEYYVHVSW